MQLIGASRFEIVELPTPAVGPDGVLIRVRACGICGSDVHGMDGSTGRRIPPIVMGHEASGEIAAVGSGVTEWKVGDRITFDSMISCGECGFCRNGQSNLCDNRQVVGVSCAEYRRNGAFAEYLAVPGRLLYRLPDSLSFEHAAMVEPVSVAVHGIARAEVKPEDRVVVIGAGMIGMLVIQVLKAKGVCDVMAVDIDPLKRQKAAELGADSVAESSTDLELDVAIEAVGIQPTVEMACRSVRKGGRVSLVGNLAPNVSVPLQVIVTRELTLYGSCGSVGNYEESLRLIADGSVRVDPMITGRISLEQAPDYFERLHRAEPGLIKVMVCP